MRRARRRALLQVAAFVVAGAGLGGLVALGLPPSTLPGQSTDFDARTPAELVSTIERSAADDASGKAALAAVVLAGFHAGGGGEWAQAELLVRRVLPARRTAAGLLARSLFLALREATPEARAARGTATDAAAGPELGDAAHDVAHEHPHDFAHDLDADIDALTQRPDAEPLALLAAAVRADGRDERSACSALLERASIRHAAPPLVLELAARAALEAGDDGKPGLPETAALLLSHLQDYRSDDLLAFQLRQALPAGTGAGARTDMGTLMGRDRPAARIYLAARASARSELAEASTHIDAAMPLLAREPGLSAHAILLALANGDVPRASALRRALTGDAAGDASIQAIDEALSVLAAWPAAQNARLGAVVIETATLAPTFTVQFDRSRTPLGILLEAAARCAPVVLRHDPVPLGACADRDALVRELKVLSAQWRGQQLLASGDPRRAAHALDEAATALGGDPRLAMLRAEVAARLDDLDAVDRHIADALSRAPQDPGLLLASARVWATVGKAVAARQSLAQLRHLGIESPDALALQAFLEARAEQVDAALAALDRARALSPPTRDTARAELLLARHAGDADAARAAARLLRSDDASESDGVLLAWRAAVHVERGEVAAAAADVAAALARAPREPDPAFAQALLLQAKGDIRQARAACDRAQGVGPRKLAARMARNLKLTLHD